MPLSRFEMNFDANHQHLRKKKSIAITRMDFTIKNENLKLQCQANICPTQRISTSFSKRTKIWRKIISETGKITERSSRIKRFTFVILSNYSIIPLLRRVCNQITRSCANIEVNFIRIEASQFIIQ